MTHPSRKVKYFELFQRNIGIFSKEEQLKFKNSTVLIAGTGGVGGPCAEALVRMGIGRLILADFDAYTISNINRQIPSTINDLGKKKVEVLEKHLRGIHPFTELKTVPEGITQKNVDQWVKQSDAVISSMDGCLTIVLQHALKRNNTIGFTGSPLLDEIMLTSFPANGNYFCDIYPYDIDENDLDKSNLLYYNFFQLLSKKDFFSENYAPVVSAGTIIAAGILAYQIAYYLAQNRLVIPPFPSNLCLNTKTMRIKSKFKSLTFLYKYVPLTKKVLVRVLTYKVNRKIKGIM